MKKVSTTFILFILLSFTPIDEAYAQSEVSNGYNPLSLRQVHESYLMWKRTLWRRVDLMEKQNKANNFNLSNQGACALYMQRFTVHKINKTHDKKIDRRHR